MEDTICLVVLLQAEVYGPKTSPQLPLQVTRLVETDCGKITHTS